MTTQYCPEHFRLQSAYFRHAARVKRHKSTPGQHRQAYEDYVNHHRTCPICREHLAHLATLGSVHPHEQEAA